MRYSPRIFDMLFRVFLVILPYMTVLSVFTSQKLSIPGFSFLKEALLWGMLLVLAYEFFRWRLQIRWTRYDLFIGLYVATLIVITLMTTGLRGIIYWGRYDFSFLLVFFVVFHGIQLLEKPISYYVRLFLISGGIALFAGMALKWPLSEDLLLYLGFSGNPSNWQFWGSVPIFHGVDGANVRRLQGIFDGPNTMGAYILIYMGVLMYYFRSKKDWYFVIGGVLLVGVMAVFYTYSRSALLGLIWWVWIVILLLLASIWKKYKLQMFIGIICTILCVTATAFLYSDKIQSVFAREWSTKGHSERMLVGYHRFLDHPLGQWLGSAWPAYRYVADLSWKARTEIEDLDRYYIPESWYIQQFIEGWVWWGILFLILILLMLIGIARVHPFLAGSFVAVLIMNLFLHTFESSLVSLTLFALLGIYMSDPSLQKHVKK